MLPSAWKPVPTAQLTASPPSGVYSHVTSLEAFKIPAWTFGSSHSFPSQVLGWCSPERPCTFADYVLPNLCNLTQVHLCSAWRVGLL